jgi:hypothetical protein
VVCGVRWDLSVHFSRVSGGGVGLVAAHQSIVNCTAAVADMSGYTLPSMIHVVHAKECAMRRKLWMMSLVLVVTLGTLTACGGDGDDEDEDEDGRGRAPQVALVQHER